MLNRIDIPIETPRVDYKKLSGDRWVNHPRTFVNVCKLLGIFKENVSRIVNQILFVLQICVSRELRQCSKLQGEGGVLSLSEASEFDASCDGHGEVIVGL